jgi:2-haloacid dehalogenase
MFDFDGFTHLTFDCYGTLIDWETGILQALKPLLERNGATPQEEQILRSYTRAEAEEEAGEYKPYRIVLGNVCARIAADFGVKLLSEDCRALPNSVGQWPPFSDTVPALRRLKTQFKLVVLSNIDDALFAQTRSLLDIDFDEVITAEQLRSYKPRRAHFEAAIKRLGVPREQILHVAQSLYHDHAPAKEMGFSTVWIDRPSRLHGSGLAPPADVRPDLELPDLQSLVESCRSEATRPLSQDLP